MAVHLPRLQQADLAEEQLGDAHEHTVRALRFGAFGLHAETPSLAPVPRHTSAITAACVSRIPRVVSGT